MKKIPWLIMALAVFFFGTAPEAFADEAKLISINFGDNAKRPSESALGETGSNTWNVLKTITTGAPLQYYDGKYSKATISEWISDGTGQTDILENRFYDAGLLPGYQLMKSYTYTYAGTGSITFSGLDSGQYNVYIYTDSSIKTINKLSVTASTSVGIPYSTQIIGDDGSSYSTFVEGKNYLVLPVTVSTDGSLTLTYTGDHLSSDGIGRVQGIELEPVPEASTLTMLMVGGAFTIIYIRRKTKDDEAAVA